MSATLGTDPNEVAMQLTGRDYVSWSAISTFQSCPLKYRFRYVDGLPEESVSSSLVFGGAIHTAIEHWLNERMAGGPEPDRDALLSVFWDHWRCAQEESTIQFGKGETVTTVADLADRVLTAFRNSDLSRPEGHIVGVEEQLRGELLPGVPDLLARIDLLIDTGDELVVRDFKTSRSAWGAGKADDSAEQLLVYSELARKLTPEKSLRMEFAVLSKTKTPSVESHPVEGSSQRVERTKQVVQRVWQAIEDRHFYSTPSPIACGSCAFQQQCRAWCG